MGWDTQCLSGGQADGAAQISCLTDLFQNIVYAVVAFSGVVLFVMLLVGGFTYLFSGGDQKQLEKAKGTITHAIIGLVLLVSAYIILALIKRFTNVDITIFKLNFTN